MRGLRRVPDPKRGNAMKPGPKRPQTTPEHAQRYQAGATLYTLARELKTDETNLRNDLREMGVAIRGRGRRS